MKKEEKLKKILDVLRSNAENDELFVAKKGEGIKGIFVTGNKVEFVFLSNKALYVIGEKGLFSKSYQLEKKIMLRDIQKVSRPEGILDDPSIIEIRTNNGEKIHVNIAEPWSPNAAFVVFSIVGGLLSEGKRRKYREWVIALIEFARGNATSEEYEFIKLGPIPP